MPPPIGTLPQIGPTWTLTPQSDGIIVLLGGTPSQFDTGGLGIDFVPDDTFAGSFTLLGMGCTADEAAANVQPLPYPFRAFVLNGVGSDLSMQPPGTVITDRSSIIIPASGQSIALLLACSAGSCAIYQQAVRGSTAP